MKKISVLDRILLLFTGLLSAYQIISGVAGKPPAALASYTVAFGVLLVAGLLIIIIGFEVLDYPSVAVISSLIPLTLSLGLVAETLPTYTGVYFAFMLVGFGGIFLTRIFKPDQGDGYVLAVVHGIAGLVIFALPLLLSLQGAAPAKFALVGIGGGLIGIGGILLAFLKSGKPILKKRTVFSLLPGLLLVMTACFVIGLSAV